MTMVVEAPGIGRQVERALSLERRAMSRTPSWLRGTWPLRLAT